MARELTTNEAIAILKQAAGLGCLTVRFTGGEPLLRSDFREIYLAARKLGLRVMIFTNATLLTPELAGLLAEVPPFEKLEVTSYGLTEKTCEASTRTPGSYEQYRRGLRLLYENKIPFVLKWAVLPPNREELEAILNGGVQVVGSDRLKPDLVTVFDLRSRRDDRTKNALIKNLRLSPEEILKIDERLDPEFKEFLSFIAGQAGCYGDLLFACLQGGGRAAVDAYGKLQFCLQLRHPETIYDLRQGSLKEALTEFLPRLRQMKARNKMYLERCGKCFLRPACLQCPARAWAESGELDEPVEYLCELTQVRARAAGLLRPGEKSWKLDDWHNRIPKAGDRTAADLNTAGKAGNQC